MQSWREWLYQRGITDRSIERFGLYWDAEQDAIAIPYWSADGQLMTTRWRRLSGDKPKYLSAPGRPSPIYNAEATDHSPVYICEGEFDTIILTQLGLDACGIPGVSIWRNEWRWLFFESEVFVVFDADEPGRKGAHRVAASLEPVAATVTVVELPDGHDVTSLYLEDRAALERALGLEVN